jgi:hypothetical protein
LVGNSAFFYLLFTVWFEFFLVKNLIVPEAIYFQ